MRLSSGAVVRSLHPRSSALTSPGGRTRIFGGGWMSGGESRWGGAGPARMARLSGLGSSERSSSPVASPDERRGPRHGACGSVCDSRRNDELPIVRVAGLPRGGGLPLSSREVSGLPPGVRRDGLRR